MLEIRYKNVYYVILLTHYEISNINIRKKNISEYKQQKKYAALIQSLVKYCNSQKARNLGYITSLSKPQQKSRAVNASLQAPAL